MSSPPFTSHEGSCSSIGMNQVNETIVEEQGSIARELYSEMLQSPSVELDCDLHESDPVDWWSDDESSREDPVKQSTNCIDRDWQKRREFLHMKGCNAGFIGGQQAAAQEGFNIGFKESVLNGYNWGFVRGITSVIACLPGGLKEKLIESEEARRKFQSLHESVQSLSTTNALKLFYQDYKKKSLNQMESVKPNSTVTDHIDDTSLLENYIQKLQSILNQTPGISKETSFHPYSIHI